jgi:outer membrane protein assembly factor BamB
MPKSVRLLLLLASSLFLTACSGLGDDNTPPPAKLSDVPLTRQVNRLWMTSTGPSMDQESLRLHPVIAGQRIFVSNKAGYVTAVYRENGRKIWQVHLKKILSSAPAVSEGILVVPSLAPQLVALNTANGKSLWQAPLANQVFAPPTIHQGRVFVKTVDGQVQAFLLKTGQLLWTYHHGAPLLVLRPSSAPQIIGNQLLVGFSDGVLVALNAQTGQLLWQRHVTFPQGLTASEQLIDIAANPVIDAQTAYITTYRGQLAAVSLTNGNIQWQRPFSSDSGLAVSKNRLYATDSHGVIWAFNRITGDVLWQQSLLHDRGLTAPVPLGDSLVVGDREGYLHWFAQRDGRPLARTLVQKRGTIFSSPEVAYPLTYVVTQQGKLSAWLLHSVANPL